MICERCIDVSSSETTIGEVCSVLAESILDGRIKRGGSDFPKDWLDSILQEQAAVANLRTAASKNQAIRDLADIPSKNDALDSIAARYKLFSSTADGRYCIIFSTRAQFIGTES